MRLQLFLIQNIYPFLFKNKDKKGFNLQADYCMALARYKQTLFFAEVCNASVQRKVKLLSRFTIHINMDSHLEKYILHNNAGDLCTAPSLWKVCHMGGVDHSKNGTLADGLPLRLLHQWTNSSLPISLYCYITLNITNSIFTRLMNAQISWVIWALGFPHSASPSFNLVTICYAFSRCRQLVKV